MKQQAYNKKEELTTRNISSLFFKYLAPSIFATLVNSVYIIVDTIMIGHFSGELGLSALNIVLPVFSLVYGLGILCGVGAGITISYYKGKADPDQANNHFTMALIILTGLVTAFMIVLNVFFDPIMRAMGGDDSNMEMIAQYGKVITLGLPVFSFSSFLGIVIRNDENPYVPMIAVIAGGVANIVLDYILIFPLHMGMQGAAIATLVCSCITVLINCLHFIKPRNTLRIRFRGLRPAMAKKVLLAGIPSFFIEVATGIMIMLFNLQIIRYFALEGEGYDKYGIAIYSVISNTVIVAISLFNGIANTCQPIIATNFGQGNAERVRKTKYLGMASAAVTSVLVYVAISVSPKLLVNMFVPDPSAYVVQHAPYAVRAYFTAVFVMGYNLIFMVYFQSTLRPWKSLLVSLSRGVVFGAILLYLLPFLFPGAAKQLIWWVIPMAELITFALCLLFDFADRKKKQTPPLPLETAGEQAAG